MMGYDPGALTLGTSYFPSGLKYLGYTPYGVIPQSAMEDVKPFFHFWVSPY